MTWHLLHAKWVTLGMCGCCPVLLTSVQCHELFFKETGGHIPFPSLARGEEELKCGWRFAVQPILLTQVLSDGRHYWGRAESRCISLIQGLLEKEVGEKEISCSWSTLLQGLCSYHHCLMWAVTLEMFAALCSPRNHEWSKKTVVTMPRKCLSCKCCRIKKVFFCSSLTLRSVAQWDSFSGGQKMGHWLLADTDNKVS